MITTNQLNKLTISRFVPGDIADIILRLKTEAEVSDARVFYTWQMSPFNMDNYYHWHAYNISLKGIIQCLKILNTPKFWEMIIFDERGYVSDRTYIETYSYKSPTKSFLPRLVHPVEDVFRGNLQKIDLLNREYYTIYLLWQQNQEYTHHHISLQFISEWVKDRRGLHERWVLYN